MILNDCCSSFPLFLFRFFAYVFDLLWPALLLVSFAWWRGRRWWLRERKNKVPSSQRNSPSPSIVCLFLSLKSKSKHTTISNHTVRTFSKKVQTKREDHIISFNLSSLEQIHSIASVTSPNPSIIIPILQLLNQKRFHGFHLPLSLSLRLGLSLGLFVQGLQVEFPRFALLSYQLSDSGFIFLSFVLLRLDQRRGKRK